MDSKHADILRVGVDIGGTFTDIAALIGDRLHYAKAPSSPDVVTGIVGGVGRVLEAARIDPRRARIIHLHGTTIATNVLLEQKGACIGLLGTSGHQDALELGRMKRAHLYDLTCGPETPAHLAPGRRRIGIRERIDGAGNVLETLDESQVLAEVARLLERFRIEAVAVCFLNAHANPLHEHRVKELIATRFPALPVSISSEVNPVFREYERVCCTAFDAYVRPKVEHYIRQLASGLKDGEEALHLMQSRGGISSARMAAERPVTMFLSGPAAGAVAGAHVGGLSDRHDLITFDVGGTSTDVSLVQHGRVAMTQEGRISRYPLRIPMVDIETIGSGGGSIAWVASGGALHVGPRSAGSAPGPACYGKGGKEPTATDASMVLGYINAARFAGGTMALAPEKSHEVIDALASTIDLDPAATALGICRILVSQMAEAIKLVTIKRGVDPRKFCLVSFGGGGGIYAPWVARELGISQVLVPRRPGTLSAFGLLVSDFELDQVQTRFVRNVAEADFATLESTFAEMEAEGERVVRREGLQDAPITHRRVLDMRYLGQAYELAVELVSGLPVSPKAMTAAMTAFHDIHHAIYGHSNPQRQIEIVNLRVVTSQAAFPLPEGLLHRDVPAGKEATEPVARRAAHFPDIGSIEAAVWDRDSLGPRSAITGPAIVESDDTTVVILPEQRATVDATGSMLIDTDAASA